LTLGDDFMRQVRRISILSIVVSGLLGGTQAVGQLGVPITDPVPLNNNADSDSGHDWVPKIATDGDENWVVVWRSDDDLSGTIGTDYDILVARSADNGATWSAPQALNNNAASDSGIDLFAALTTDGAGHWVAVWRSDDDLGGTIGDDGDILVARSTDNGATWSNPAPLNNNADTDSGKDSNPHLTTDAAGHWVAVWWSEEDLGGTIGTDSDILVARSTDDGVTWTDPEPLNNNAASDSGFDFLARVTTDGLGNWVAVWDSEEDLGGTIGTDLDILVARSTDNGVSWSDPHILNSNAGTDSGDDESPKSSTDEAGNWVAVWDSEDDLGGTLGVDDDILVSRSVDDGATWSAPEPLNTSAASDSGNDWHAQVTTDGAGNWVAVWASKEDLPGATGSDFDILVAHSTDNGASWSDPQALNAYADTDSDLDEHPDFATDGLGEWVAVWHSTHDLGAAIGADRDILVARFALPDCNNNGVGDGQDIAGSTSQDCDGNGVPDECEPDEDADGVIDACDPCPEDNPDDGDGDGLCESDDNCPEVANADQADMDGDSVGDLCDDDIDGDGFLNSFFGQPEVEDCDDFSAQVSPDAAETCDDGIDNDCNGQIDLDDPACGCGAGGCGAGVGMFLVLGMWSLCGAKSVRRRSQAR
jgi:hypothetical protein